MNEPIQSFCFSPCGSLLFLLTTTKISILTDKGDVITYVECSNNAKYLSFTIDKSQSTSFLTCLGSGGEIQIWSFSFQSHILSDAFKNKEYSQLQIMKSEISYSTHHVQSQVVDGAIEPIVYWGERLCDLMMVTFCDGSFLFFNLTNNNNPNQEEEKKDSDYPQEEDRNTEMINHEEEDFDCLYEVEVNRGMVCQMNVLNSSLIFLKHDHDSTTSSNVNESDQLGLESSNIIIGVINISHIGEEGGVVWEASLRSLFPLSHFSLSRSFSNLPLPFIPLISNYKSLSCTVIAQLRLEKDEEQDVEKERGIDRIFNFEDEHHESFFFFEEDLFLSFQISSPTTGSHHPHIKVSNLNEDTCTSEIVKIFEMIRLSDSIEDLRQYSSPLLSYLPNCPTYPILSLIHTTISSLQIITEDDKNHQIELWRRLKNQGLISFVVKLACESRIGLIAQLLKKLPHLVILSYGFEWKAMMDELRINIQETNENEVKILMYNLSRYVIHPVSEIYPSFLSTSQQSLMMVSHRLLMEHETQDLMVSLEVGKIVCEVAMNLCEPPCGNNSLVTKLYRSLNFLLTISSPSFSLLEELKVGPLVYWEIFGKEWVDILFEKVILENLQHHDNFVTTENGEKLSNFLHLASNHLRLNLGIILMKSIKAFIKHQNSIICEGFEIEQENYGANGDYFEDENSLGSLNYEQNIQNWEFVWRLFEEIPTLSMKFNCLSFMLQTKPFSIPFSFFDKVEQKVNKTVSFLSKEEKDRLEGLYHIWGLCGLSRSFNIKEFESSNKSHHYILVSLISWKIQNFGINEMKRLIDQAHFGSFSSSFKMVIVSSFISQLLFMREEHQMYDENQLPLLLSLITNEIYPSEYWTNYELYMMEIQSLVTQISAIGWRFLQGDSLNPFTYDEASNNLITFNKVFKEITSIVNVSNFNPFLQSLNESSHLIVEILCSLSEIVPSMETNICELVNLFSQDFHQFKETFMKRIVYQMEEEELSNDILLRFIKELSSIINIPFYQLLNITTPYLIKRIYHLESKKKDEIGCSYENLIQAISMIENETISHFNSMNQSSEKRGVSQYGECLFISAQQLAIFSTYPDCDEASRYLFMTKVKGLCDLYLSYCPQEMIHSVLKLIQSVSIVSDVGDRCYWDEKKSLNLLSQETESTSLSNVEKNNDSQFAIDFEKLWEEEMDLPSSKVQQEEGLLLTPSSIIPLASEVSTSLMIISEDEEKTEDGNQALSTNLEPSQTSNNIISLVKELQDHGNHWLSIKICSYLQECWTNFDDSTKNESTQTLATFLLESASTSTSYDMPWCVSLLLSLPPQMSLSTIQNSSMKAFQQRNFLSLFRISTIGVEVCRILEEKHYEMGIWLDRFDLMSRNTKWWNEFSDFGISIDCMLFEQAMSSASEVIGISNDQTDFSSKIRSHPCKVECITIDSIVSSMREINYPLSLLPSLLISSKLDLSMCLDYSRHISEDDSITYTCFIEYLLIEKKELKLPKQTDYQEKILDVIERIENELLIKLLRNVLTLIKETDYEKIGFVCELLISVSLEDETEVNVYERYVNLLQTLLMLENSSERPLCQNPQMSNEDISPESEGRVGLWRLLRDPWGVIEPYLSYSNISLISTLSIPLQLDRDEFYQRLLNISIDEFLNTKNDDYDNELSVLSLDDGSSVEENDMKHSGGKDLIKIGEDLIRNVESSQTKSEMWLSIAQSHRSFNDFSIQKAIISCQEWIKEEAPEYYITTMDNENSDADESIQSIESLTFSSSSSISSSNESYINNQPSVLFLKQLKEEMIVQKRKEFIQMIHPDLVRTLTPFFHSSSYTLISQTFEHLPTIISTLEYRNPYIIQLWGHKVSMFLSNLASISDLFSSERLEELNDEHVQKSILFDETSEFDGDISFYPNDNDTNRSVGDSIIQKSIPYSDHILQLVRNWLVTKFGDEESVNEISNVESLFQLTKLELETQKIDKVVCQISIAVSSVLHLSSDSDTTSSIPGPSQCLLDVGLSSHLPARYTEHSRCLALRSFQTLHPSISQIPGDLSSQANSFDLNLREKGVWWMIHLDRMRLPISSNMISISKAPSLVHTLWKRSTLDFSIIPLLIDIMCHLQFSDVDFWVLVLANQSVPIRCKILALKHLSFFSPHILQAILQHQTQQQDDIFISLSDQINLQLQSRFLINPNSTNDQKDCEQKEEDLENHNPNIIISPQKQKVPTQTDGTTNFLSDLDPFTIQLILDLQEILIEVVGEEKIDEKIGITFQSLKSRYNFGFEDISIMKSDVNYDQETF